MTRKRLGYFALTAGLICLSFLGLYLANLANEIYPLFCLDECADLTPHAAALWGTVRIFGVLVSFFAGTLSIISFASGVTS